MKMKVNERNAIMQHISINTYEQPIELTSVVGNIGRSTGVKGAMAGVYMGLLLACMPNLSMASTISHDHQRIQEEIILKCVRTSPLSINAKKAELIEKLDEMGSLQKEWVPGGLPISVSAIDFTKQIVLKCSDDELLHWNVGPYVNGTVMMYYRGAGNRSSINIGKSTISAFMKVGPIFKAFQQPHDKGITDVLEIIHALG